MSRIDDILMAIRNILEFPDPRLRTVAKPVNKVDGRVQQLITDMFETMYAAPGIGLAATQINVHEQIIVIDISEEKSSPLTFINPQIEILDETLFGYEEGCLSIPGFYEEICRPRHVRVNALDHNGESFIIEPVGLLAVCIQHEMDHLKGKLFVDYISNIKRQRIRQKLEKKHKAESAASAG